MNARTLLLAIVHGLLIAPANAAEEGRAPIVDLSGSTLLATEQNRVLLDYVVQCALPEGFTATATHRGQEFQFHGAMGIAPDWRVRALTHDEQSAASACLLARTNAYGVPVQISLRSKKGPLARISSFATSRSERLAYPVFEGAFFGNVFSQSPHSFACRGDTSPEVESALRSLKRICTLPTEQLTPEGRPISACGFVVLGQCDDPDVRRLMARYANAAAEVYLPLK